MNIWLINQYAIPPSQSGPTRHFALASQLVRLGHKVNVYASSFDHLTRSETRNAKQFALLKEDIQGVDYLWMKTPPYQGNSMARIWNMVVYSFMLLVFLWRGKNGRPDLIYASSPHLFGCLSGYILSRRFNVPFVLEIRDLWPQTFVDMGSFKANHPVVLVLGLIERFLYRKADRIVTLLPGSQEHMVSKGADLKKIHWIPNGVDPGLLPEYAPKRSGKEFRITYAGAHGLANCLDTIIDAAVLLKKDNPNSNVTFHFLGDGPERLKLTAKAKALGLTNITFLGSVPKTEVYAHLQAADAFVESKRATGLYRWGISLNKLFDYFAIGRPVILCIDCPYDPVSEAGAGFTVRPEEPAALAKAILEIVNMPDAQREQMGLRGRKYVFEKHDLRNLAAQLETIFLSLAGNRKTKHAHQ